MKIISITNQKGGVGKTTLCVSLAGLLHQRGYRVLVLDLDPQGSLTHYFQLPVINSSKSVYDLFKMRGGVSRTDLNAIIRRSKYPNLDILPSASLMNTVERQYGSVDGIGLVITRTLNNLQDQYDYVLIDTPPAMGVFSINALAACDRLVIPVQTEYLAIKGLEQLLRSIDMINKSISYELDYIIVPTMFDRRTAAAVQSLHEIRVRFEGHVWPGYIPVDTRLRNASRLGVLPSEIISPKQRSMRAFNHLLDHILNNDRASLVMSGVHHPNRNRQ